MVEELHPCNPDDRRAAELCAAFEHAPVPLVTFDSCRRLSCANAAARRIWKFPVKPSFPITAFPAGISRIGEAKLAAVMATGRESTAELRWRDEEGEHIFEAFLSPRRDGSGTVTGVIMACAGTAMQEKIRNAGLHDALTGLYNRTFFEEELRRIDTGRALPIAFIMGNVRNMKLTNDLFGHQEGDMLLIRIAEILKSCCRCGDLVARRGGDEFVILLPRTGSITAEEIAGRIRRRCAGLSGVIVPPRISLGVSVKLKEDVNIYSILCLAERRMYRNRSEENRGNREAVIGTLLGRAGGTHSDLPGRTRRLQGLIRLMGKDLGLMPEEAEELAQLAPLHDIGTALVSEHILHRQGQLPPREWESVMKHSEWGYRIVYSFVDIRHNADTILAHHERWDGKGYPRGLRGSAIPRPARILSILVAYDAMTHDRFYRRKLSQGEALDELEKCAGSQFDPALVALFTSRIRQASPRSLPDDMPARL